MLERLGQQRAYCRVLVIRGDEGNRHVMVSHDGLSLHTLGVCQPLTAEFFLQTIDTVFVKHALPKGEMKHRAMPVPLAAIRRVGLLTVEGENDDISGIGQTLAAQDLCQKRPTLDESKLPTREGRSLRRIQRFPFP